MIFADKLITLRKKAGWIPRNWLKSWRDPAIGLQVGGCPIGTRHRQNFAVSRLFGVTTDYLLKEEQGEPEYTAEDDTPALHRVTLTQAGDYLKKARANAPQNGAGRGIVRAQPGFTAGAVRFERV